MPSHPEYAGDLPCQSYSAITHNLTRPLTESTRQAIIDYLFGLVTEERKTKLIQTLGQRTKHLTLVLENVFQTRNISAVIRSCECFGIQDLHVIENYNDFTIDPEITMGSAKWIDIYRYQHTKNNTQRCLEQLKQNGYQIAALTLSQGKNISLNECDIQPKTALCIGTEKTGLTSIAHEMADINLHIPMVGFTDSFNLSVTAAICLFELTQRLKQTTQQPTDWQLVQADYQVTLIDWLTKSLPNGKKILTRFLTDLS